MKNKNIFEIIKYNINIVEIIQKYVCLKQSGTNYKGLCPFHQEKTPSFTVSTVKNFYHCFGCSEHGDAISFIAKIKNISYSDAAKNLAREFGIKIERDNYANKLDIQKKEFLYSILQIASNFFSSCLDENAIKYLKSRNVDKEIIENFNIGFAPRGNKLLKYFESKNINIELCQKVGIISKNHNNQLYDTFTNRIMFPIKNVYKKIVGFGGRSILKNNNIKYINTCETEIFKKSDLLFGENIAFNQAYKFNNIILVEGYLDLIMMHKQGFTQTVASLGTSVSENNIDRILNKTQELIICLDGDKAGRKSTLKLIKICLQKINIKKRVSIIILPDNIDPDQVIKSSEYNMQTLMQQRITLSQAIWHYSTESITISSPEDLAILEDELLSYTIKDTCLRRTYRAFFKEKIKNISYQYHLSLRNKKIDLLDHKIKKVSREKIEKKSFPEKDNLEAEILKNILHNLIVLFNHEIYEKLCKINLYNKKLSYLLDCLIDFFDKNKDKKLTDVEKHLFESNENKNTCNFFNLLETEALPSSSEEKKNNIELLLNKHTILILKDEHLSALNKGEYEKQNFYLKEIKFLEEKINHFMAK